MSMMKWSGWGAEGVSFSADDKPALGPFLQRHLGLDPGRAVDAGVAFGDVEVPEPNVGGELLAALEGAVGDAVSTDPLDRVVHARGKSLRDLVRHRAGQLGRIPDVVVRPADEDAVAALLQVVLDADAVAIPFGGGT
ncbi:MAG TPA: FAD-binding oxidoreductase, partial [Baekduia sp.]|nr:FAD-binding oxidoreductase [Baekduia sp.]